jgi:RHS repeat-associated protein
MASSLASQLTPHPITFSDPGTGTITVTADTPGPNYALSGSVVSNDPSDFGSGSFSVGVSGPNLTGGVYPVTTYDSGTLTVTVNGFQASVSYNQNLNNTPQLMAGALAAALSVPSSPVTASANNTTITVTAKTVGSAGEYQVQGGTSTSFAATSTVLGNDTNPGGLFAPYITFYSYDPLGNLLRAEQHGGTTDSTKWRVRSFTYDSLSRLLTSTNPEKGTVSYQYNNDGVMTSKTDARGITVNYNPSDAPIDVLHRVLKKMYSNSDPAVTFVYDQGTNGIGRLSSASVGTISKSYSYDPLGRVVGQTDCLPSGCRTTSVPVNGYNLASELVSLNYPDNRNVTTGYNPAGRLTGVNLAAYNGVGVNVSYYSVPQSTSSSSWGYLPTGAMNRGTYGNGYIETTGYNNRMQVASITEVKGTSTILNKAYGYYDASSHNNGNVQTITDVLSSAKNQTYTYDQLNRIATATEMDNAFNITFTVDAWGNMNESGTSNFAQPFDVTNRMQGWSYDAAGNLLNDGSHVYTYDAESRIKTVGGNAATYTYGPGGERVRKDTASGSTEYIYFGGGVIAELNPATGAWTDYIFASGKRGAKDTSNNGSGAQYYHGDHLGSTRIMTDATGTVISSCTYAPFGEQVGCSPDNASNHYRFSGKERDAETGADYFGGRYYGSSMGRFLTPDWSEGPATVPYAHLENPQTLNLYSYVDNNPINGIDVDGHSPHESMVAGPVWDVTSMMSNGAGDITDSGEDGAAIDAYNTFAKAYNAEVDAYNQQVDAPQNQQTREDIAKTAEKYNGSTDWAYSKQKGYFACNTNKCNAFVGDVTKEAGAPAWVTGSNGKARYPLAAEWANKNTKIANWRVLGKDESPQAGDVAAYKLSGGGTSYSGHSGIVTSVDAKGGVHGMAAHENVVGPDNKFDRSVTPTVVYRRYTGD